MANQTSSRAQRAQDFKNQKIKSAGDFNFDQHNKEGSEGTHVSGQEVRHLRNNHKRNGGSGNLRDTYNALTAQKEGGAEFGARAQTQYDRMGGRIDKIDARRAAKQKANAAGSTGQQKNPIDEAVTGEADNVPSNNQQNTTEIDNTQEQTVNQNNDIDTTVHGNDNTIINNQDNSVRQYGGDNRSFVYNSNGGQGSLFDTPASMATMGGFYDVDDSPAAQASFNDMYKDFNKDNGTRFAGEALATVSMFDTDARDYTPESMENAIGKSTQYSYDRADRQTGHVFGDIWNDDYITEEWKMPSAPAPIESNAGQIADDAKEDIEDM